MEMGDFSKRRTVNLVPQQARIICEYIEPKSAIISPDNAETPENAAWKVVAVGSGRLLENGEVYGIPLEIGDEVVFAPQFHLQLNPAQYGGRKLAVVDYAGVLFKIEREPGDEIVRSSSRIIRPEVVEFQA